MSHARPLSPSSPSLVEGDPCLNAEVYAELRRVAQARMGRWVQGTTLQPTVLVHEAWMRLARRQTPWEDRGHFFAHAFTAMRHILIDHARRRARVRHGGDWVRDGAFVLEEFSAPGQEERLLLIDDAVKALGDVDPLAAQIVEARFFGGLTTEEIAQTFALGKRTVERRWAKAKVWLFRWMRQQAGG